VGRGLLCLTVRHGARFVVPDIRAQSESGAWGCLMCLTVGRGARFAVSESVAWVEVCCV